MNPSPGLTRLVHEVREVAVGDRTSFADGVLTVSDDEATALVASPALTSVRVSWVSPGASARIVKVLDAVEPRAKGPERPPERGAGPERSSERGAPPGVGAAFPGLLGPVEGAGSGQTHVLRGVAVVAAGHLPRAQEAVVDMSGPAAPLSPLGATHNLVVEFEPADGAAWEDVDDALRRGVLALAARLAEAAVDVAPHSIEELPRPGPVDGLPLVGAVTNLQTQGAFKDVFVLGRSFTGQAPVFLDPNQLDDGAVVSGQFGHPSLKNPTYVHQNHPVVAALRARHGRDLAFAGLVISPEPVDQGQKEQVSKAVAEMCAQAGWTAAIVTKEGGGNADADMALKMDALEDLGVVAVGLFGEMAGAEGTGPSVVVPPERATAMVSTGNYDERLTLPAVEVALGGAEVALLGVPATAELELPTAVVYCSLSPLGWGRLTCA